MKKQMFAGAAALVVVAVPAVIGLWGNASFAESVPVRVPAGQTALVSPSPTPSASPSASPSGTDDNGGETPRDQRVEPGDDRDVQGAVTVSPSPSASPDDNGGQVPRDQRVEPGDDRTVDGGSGSGGSGSGSDDSGSDDSSGSGHGGGDSSDDSGHGGDD